MAIDARCLGERRTSNRTYWSELVGALGHRSDVELLLFSNAPIPEADVPKNAKAVIRSSGSRWFSLFVLPALANQYAADVAHVQYTVSPLFKLPVVTMVHDVSFLIEPRWFGRKDRILLRLSVPAACRRAACVLVPTETAKRELRQYIPIAESKVLVTSLAASQELLKTDPSMGRKSLNELTQGFPFVLLVGGQSPRKNLAGAVAAVLEARREMAGLRLLVTGRIEGELPEWVISPGSVDEAVLAAAYAEAHALIHPSYHEGFGLTILEAMALGCPVVSTNRGSIPEVAGGAALLFDVDDIAGMARGILRLAEVSFREIQVAEGRAMAAEFSWERTAERTIDGYRQALASQFGKG